MEFFLNIAQKGLFILLFVLTCQHSFASENVNDDSPCNKSFEITDQSNQVILGIKKDAVYMYFSEDLRTYLNWTFEEEYLRDLNSFKDSNGEFIPVPAIYIHESKIEYPLRDIQSVVSDNGILAFTYKNRLAVSFEDILLPNGSVLSNFSAEDAQKFVDFFNHKMK
jgi:hypothetical protein